ncbi:uncharacterized protein LOC119685994 [Teleopsis dalmanni]|uniref:uncharacterized protein LOC119685994 n=1 Tax=Teleopsis dalmanni TaxID=139649 RepID=UPI0018CCA93B|nr:uncharacterized protein LOC119685994 [Teleopsis dalmanni]
MFATGLLYTVICCLVKESFSRSLSVSFNLSLALTDPPKPSLSTDMLRTCIKETEISMAELERFRISLLTNDPEVVTSIEGDDQNIDDNQFNIEDYDANSPLTFSERNEESLQCFTHCLYEQMGLVKNGMFVEREFFSKLYSVMERQKTKISECMNMDSDNKCEVSYKMHMCLSRLKTLEAERRIRKILEYGNRSDMDDAEITDTTTDGTGADMDKQNEIDAN